MPVKLFKRAHDMKGHLMIGAGVLALLYFLNQKFSWLQFPTERNEWIKLIAIGLVYSLLPDTDQPGSRIRKYFTLAVVSAIIYFIYIGKTNYAIVGAVILGLLHLIDHREFIHSFIASLLFSAPLLYLGALYFAVGVILYNAHLIADKEFSLGGGKDFKIFGGK